MRSKSVAGKLHIEKIWVEAKRGSILGRTHDDVGHVRIVFIPNDTNKTFIFEDTGHSTKNEMNIQYNRLRGVFNLV